VLRGAADRVQGLLSLERVQQAVVHRDRAQGRFFVTADQFSDEKEVQAYLDAGEPIVWNGARGATAALDRLSEELSAVFGAQVWANIYSTGVSRKPFDIHFDTHDVLAVQCDGRKEWLVSKVRINCPLDGPALAPATQRVLEETRAEALAQPLMNIVTEPGDVLYIPRGQFHDARTVAGRSLHVTFAISPPTGMDVLQVLARMALRESLFREYLPHRTIDGDDAQTRTQLTRMGKRLLELAQSDELRDALGRTSRIASR
jgi:ribosomal protein L16 Arg81 hydroxylase